LPFIVLVTIPLAFTGAFVALCITGMQFSIVAVIGLIILMGVITNNGIVLIDYINKAREDGLTIEEAVVTSAKVRARPILITAISTICALIPSAIGFGASGAMMQPLAIASIGGLLYATLMSFFVVPAFYVIMFTFKNRREQAALAGVQKALDQKELLLQEGKNEKIGDSKLENEQDKRTSARVSKRVRAKKPATKG